MKYIALDLETTGLDPRHDTIIEIAAIRFGVEETRIVPEEEHSMLVAPGFPLSHQVSMITGITNTMLEGRQSWEQIRMNVQQFIDTGDIFVGHNVSFDISFLEAHGITFPKQNGAIQTLDTFELAQIFSLESESLNLAFLCKKYALGGGGEHRALEDVKMSLSLLSFYLQKDLTHYEDAVLRFFCEHEKIQSSISLFCDLKEEHREKEDIFDFLHSCSRTEDSISHPRAGSTGKDQTPSFTYTHTHLPHSRDEEWQYIQGKIRDSQSPLCLIIPGKEQLEMIQHEIDMKRFGDIRYAVYLQHRNLVSPRALMIHLKDIPPKSLERQQTLVITKILFWLAHTKTGNLSELKFYNNELSIAQDFRTQEGENNLFTEQLRDAIDHANIILIEARQFFTLSDHPFPYGTTALLRDMTQYEQIVRKVMTEKILLQAVWEWFSQEGYDTEVLFAIEYLMHALESIPKRPAKEDPFPPGEYGETYSISYEALWSYSPWITWAGKVLSTASRRVLPENIRHSLHILSEITQFHDGNSSLVITIEKSGMTLYRIPRDTRSHIENTVRKHFTYGEGYDFGLSGPLMGMFFEAHVSETCTLIPGSGNGQKHIGSLPLRGKYNRITESIRMLLARTQEDMTPHRGFNVSEGGNSQKGCIVILTTGKKYVLEIAAEMKQHFGTSHTVLAQGVSGGKAKMLAHARSTPERTILVGLYDTWIDESLLWESTAILMMTKIPFDPPSDVYFLGKTVGMSNNFMEYALPLTIEKINRLLFRLHAASPDAEVFCIDERLWKNDWGKYLRQETGQK